MLTISTQNLSAGWFSGTGGGRTQFLGPGGYFSTEGFPAQAYTMPPTYIENPEVRLAQQVIAESVRGALPVANTSLDTTVPVSKMMASMTIASVSTAMIPMAGVIGSATAIAGAVLPIIYWLGRAMGIIGTAAGVFGIISGILDMFSFGRIFLYYKGEELGSLPPEIAWIFYYQARPAVRNNLRMRMEGADKGGYSGSIPLAPRGQDPDDGGDGKSPIEKFNPFYPGSLGDRLNPFVRGIRPDGSGSYAV